MSTAAHIAWDQVDTVLLDMDGTLLDLHFDNHFWREYVPARYAHSRGLDLPLARSLLNVQFRRAEGTLDWYCVDYWTRELNLDIALLKREVAQFIAVKPGALAFLARLQADGKRRVLVTNAHRKSLALKLEHTRLDAYLDRIICAHDLGRPKEDLAFWTHLNAVEAFDPRRTLLIDDNLGALRSARDYGIAQLLAVLRPSSQAPPVTQAEFRVVTEFDSLGPPQRSIAAHP